MVRPGNLEARYNLAVMLEHISHTKEAERAYLENMRRGAHLPTIINLSAMYTRQGKRDQATQLLKQASRTFRSEASPWYLLAQMAEKDGNIGLARHNYQNSIKADPLNGFAHIRFARFLQKSSAISPGRRIRKRMVKLLYAMGEKERARNMERGLKLMP